MSMKGVLTGKKDVTELHDGVDGQVNVSGHTVVELHHVSLVTFVWCGPAKPGADGTSHSVSVCIFFHSNIYMVWGMEQCVQYILLVSSKSFVHHLHWAV